MRLGLDLGRFVFEGVSHVYFFILSVWDFLHMRAAMVSLDSAHILSRRRAWSQAY